MKTLLSLILIIFSFGFNTLESGSITKEEREFAISYYEKTQTDFLSAIEKLNSKQVNFKSDSAKWSILECAEHIVVSEEGIFGITQGTLKQPSDSSKQKEITVTNDDIIKRLTNRSFKAQAPEIIKPTGRFSDIASIKEKFLSQRKVTIAYLLNTQDDLHFHYWKHPATGTIDLYQSLILLSAHTKRHTLQIEEVKASQGFPK